MLETFKVLLKAKSKAAGANLSQKRIDAIADRLNKKFPDVTEEADHDDKIDLAFDEQDFKDLSAADDFQRAKDAKDKKDKADKDKADKTDSDKSDNQDKGGDDDVKTMLKALMEQNKSLAEKVAGIEAEKQVTGIKQKVNEALKDVPASYGWQKRALPQKEEEIEAFVSDVQNDYKEFTKDLDNKGFNMPMPRGGGGKPSDKATPEQIKSITDKIIK